MSNAFANLTLAPTNPPPGHPDAELIRLCDRMVELDAHLLVSDTGEADLTEAEILKIGRAWDEAAQTVVDKTPRTPEGLRAKFRVFRAVLRQQNGFGGLVQQWGEALVRDVLGEC